MMSGLPISLKIDEDINILGFSIGAQFTGVFSNYDVNKSFDKKFFGNEVFTVTEEASKKDSLFWEKSRPILLTKVERKDYIKGDSLKLVRESDEYKDSLDNRYNKVWVMDILLHGGYYTKRKKQYSLNYNSLIKGLSFNAVEGWNTDLEVDFRKWYPDEISRKNINMKAKLSYGFADERWKASWFGSYRPDNRTYEAFFGGVGSDVTQFNKADPVHPLFNSAYALLDKKNYIKLYLRDYGMFGYQNELINGLYATGHIKYEVRHPLENSTDFSWFNKDAVYEANNPVPFERAQCTDCFGKIGVPSQTKIRNHSTGKTSHWFRLSESISGVYQRNQCSGV